MVQLVERKAAYDAPVLVVFGTVLDLTASGTLNSCEGGASGKSGNCNKVANTPTKRG